MTFLEAAIELLRQAGRPLSIKDLTQRAIEQRLLTHEGRTPELTMQARLAQELRKGPHTLLLKNANNTFALRRYDKPRREGGEVAPEERSAEPAARPVRAPIEVTEADVLAEAADEADGAGDGEGEAAAAGEDVAAGAEGPRKRRRRGGRGRGKKKPGADAIVAAPAAADDVADRGREAFLAAEAELEAEPEAAAEADDEPMLAVADEDVGGVEDADADADVDADVDEAVAEADDDEDAVDEDLIDEDPEEGTPEEAIMAERLAEEAEAAEAAEAAAAAAAAAEAARHVVEAARRAEEARAAARRAEVTREATRIAEEQARAAAVFVPRGDDEPAVDLDGIMAPTPRRRALVDLPDEAALAAEYASELEDGDTATAPVEGELVDERTADEDRPMLDEIQADGRDRGRNRRRRGGKPPERGAARGARPAAAGAGADRDRGRGGRGGERDRDRDRDRARGDQARPGAATAGVANGAVGAHPGSAPAPAPVPVHAAAEGEGALLDATTTSAPLPGGPRQGLADLGFQLLRSIGDGRPVHARQLAAMAVKRRAVSGDPEDLGRALRVALLDDARSRQARGLRPRVRHQGAGNFALATTRLESELGALEEQLAQRAEALARETRVTMRRRLAKLPLPALENLARVLLERLGYTDIERVKRVEATGYLSARVKQGAVPQRVLIGVRSGGDEAARRAVGELRAGVAAKQLDAGLLLCTARVGSEAEREVRVPGAPITVYDGDAFADALIAAGVGVLRVVLPVAYLDAEFFAELTDGT